MSNFVINPYIVVTPSTFTPTDISDLYAWYDATDSDTITKDGSNRISKWENKEGTTARDLVQSTCKWF